jgi:hypothetical protein
LFVAQPLNNNNNNNKKMRDLNLCAKITFAEDLTTLMINSLGLHSRVQSKTVQFFNPIYVIRLIPHQGLRQVWMGRQGFRPQMTVFFIA